MKKFASGISKALDWVDTFSAFVFMGIMIVSIFFQVVFRYVLKAPLTWSEELARYAMIYIVFIGVGYGTKEGSHLGVEIVSNLLPEKPKKMMLFLAQVVTFILYMVLFYYALQCTMNIYANGQLSATMRIPMWMAYAALPIGFGSALIRQIEVMYKMAANKSEGTAEGGENQ